MLCAALLTWLFLHVEKTSLNSGGITVLTILNKSQSILAICGRMQEGHAQDIYTVGHKKHTTIFYHKLLQYLTDFDRN